MKDIYDLITSAQQGSKEAEKEIVNLNIPLVKSCMHRFLNLGYEYDDLFQLGCIGLIKAVRNFDISYKVRFSTYAVPMILGEIRRYIRDSSQIKVSRSLKELFIRASKERKKLSSALMRDPTMGEIAAECGCDCERLTLAFEACRPCESIYKPVSNDSGELILGDTLKGKSSPEDEIEKIALKSAIMKLSERERKIMLLRYFRGKTQTEVAESIGVSQVQISRIEKKVLSALKEELK